MKTSTRVRPNVRQKFKLIRRRRYRNGFRLAQFRTATSFYRVAAAAAAAAASVRSRMRVVAGEWRWALEGTLLEVGGGVHSAHRAAVRAYDSATNSGGRRFA